RRRVPKAALRGLDRLRLLIGAHPRTLSRPAPRVLFTPSTLGRFPRPAHWVQLVDRCPLKRDQRTLEREARKASDQTHFLCALCVQRRLEVVLIRRGHVTSVLSPPSS